MISPRMTPPPPYARMLPLNPRTPPPYTRREPYVRDPPPVYDPGFSGDSVSTTCHPACEWVLSAVFDCVLWLHRLSQQSD